MGAERRGALDHLKGMVSLHRRRYKETHDAYGSAIETYQRLGDRISLARERLHLSKALLKIGDSEGDPGRIRR